MTQTLNRITTLNRLTNPRQLRTSQAAALPCPVLIRFEARAERLFLLLCGQLRDQASRLQAVLVQEPYIEALMTRLERILQEL